MKAWILKPAAPNTPAPGTGTAVSALLVASRMLSMKNNPSIIVGDGGANAQLLRLLLAGAVRAVLA
jgi:hypothetical protein